MGALSSYPSFHNYGGPYNVLACPSTTHESESQSTNRVGMDLHKVTFPTFVLESRSMLERITDFTAHPDFIFG